MELWISPFLGGLCFAVRGDRAYGESLVLGGSAGRSSNSNGSRSRSRNRNRSCLSVGQTLLLVGCDSVILDVRLLVLAAIVFGNVKDDEAVGNAADAVKPEKIQGLQEGQQDQRDDEGDGGLELLAGPVKLVGPDRLVLVKEAVDDAQVEVVAQVGPYADEQGEVGALHRAIDVIKAFGCLRAGGPAVSACVIFMLNILIKKSPAASVRTARKKSLMSWVMYTAMPM